DDGDCCACELHQGVPRFPRSTAVFPGKLCSCAIKQQCEHEHRLSVHMLLCRQATLSNTSTAYRYTHTPRVNMHIKIFLVLLYMAVSKTFGNSVQKCAFPNSD
ncbi:unnamed protein product, partial [Ectocarpus sp. 4 AP-2014]